MAEEVDGEFIPKELPLPQPRPLTTRESELIDFLLAGPLGRGELRAQAKTAQVVGLCSCGCPSVFLAVKEGAPPASFSVHEVPSDNTDAVPLTAYARNPRSRTSVTLHVVQGYMVELEIWAGRFGARPRPRPERLEYAEILFPDLASS